MSLKMDDHQTPLNAQKSNKTKTEQNHQPNFVQNNFQTILMNFHTIKNRTC